MVLIGRTFPLLALTLVLTSCTTTRYASTGRPTTAQAVQLETARPPPFPSTPGFIHNRDDTIGAKTAMVPPTTDAMGVRTPYRHIAGKFPLLRSIIEPTHAVGHGHGAASKVSGQIVADHLMVRVQPGTSRLAVDALASRHGATVRSKLGVLDTYLLACEPGQLDAFRSDLHSEPVVSQVEYDRILSIDLTPNDPQFYNQWGLTGPIQSGTNHQGGINAEAGWAICHDASDVVVAIIDTGIDLTHPDLLPNLWHNPNEISGNQVDDDGNGYVDDLVGWNFHDGNAMPQDDNMHGTHVAGIIGAAGNNGIGVTGVCWSVQLMPLKVFDQYGSGYLSDCIVALDYASLNGARIINCSWGAQGTSQELADAIERCRSRGCVVVAAAGNSSSDDGASPFVPASCVNPGLIAVAALDWSGSLASYSNYGLANVGIAAPGSNITSTMPVVPTTPMQQSGLAGGYGQLSGTSMAAPFVSGAAALVAHVAPGLDPAGIIARLRERSRIVSGLISQVQGGRVLDLQDVLNPAWIPSNASMMIDDMWYPEVAGQSDGDGFLTPGDHAWIQIRLGNQGQSVASGVQVAVSCADPLAGTINTPSVLVEDLSPGGLVTIDHAFWIHFSTSLQPMATVRLNVTLTWNGGSTLVQRDILMLTPELVRQTHHKMDSTPAAVIGWGGVPGGGIERFALSETERLYGFSGGFISQRLDGSLAAWGDQSLSGVWNPCDYGRVTKIAIDATPAFALRDDGTIGGLSNEAIPPGLPANLTGIVDIACGNSFGLALTRDQVVHAWGDNSYGQTDVPADLPPACAVRAHWYSSLAILVDGSVRTWGQTTSASPSGVNDIIEAGIMYTDTVVALRANGSIVSWGTYAESIQTQVSGWGLGPITKLAISGGRFAVMDAAGNVRNYRIVDGSSIDLPPVSQPISSIAVTYENIGIAMTDGSVICRGDDSHGQLRLPQVPEPGIVQIAPSTYGGFLLHADGTVAEFGMGSMGNLAGTDALVGVEAIASRFGPALAQRQGRLTAFGTIYSNSPAGSGIPADLECVVQAAAGNLGQCALRNDGSVIAWGGAPKPPDGLRLTHVEPGYGFAVGITEDKHSVCWPDIGWEMPDHAVQVACGYNHAVVLRDDGSLAAFGAGAPTPALDDVVDVAGGMLFEIALQRSGQVSLWQMANGLDVPTGTVGAISILAGGGSGYAILPAKATAVIALADAVHPYDGRPYLAHATTTPPGLILQHQAVGMSTLPVEPGTYLITATVDSWGYTGQATATLTIHGVGVTLSSTTPLYVNRSFLVDINFTEDVVALPSTALTCRNCTISTISGGGSHWQAQVEPIADGELGIRVRDLGCRNADGAANTASEELIRQMDRLAPFPVLKALTNQTFSISWSEPVLGFSPGQSLVVNGGILTNMQQVDLAGQMWICQITRNSAIESATVYLPGGAATDLAGNQSSVSTTLKVIVTSQEDSSGNRCGTGGALGIIALGTFGLRRRGGRGRPRTPEGMVKPPPAANHGCDNY